MSRVVAVLQARVGSTRLPGKVLEEIAGSPMCVLVANRVGRAERVDRVVIATTTAAADDPVVELCRVHGIACVRGSEDDVLDRYLQAATEHAAEVVVRVTADCPLIDPVVVDTMLAAFAVGGHDYVSNALVRTYPHGQEVEVFSFAALERSAREATRPSQREHVTSYMLATPGFRLRNVEHRPDLSAEHHRWTVDEPADLAFVRTIAARLPAGFSMRDVLDLLVREPELRRLEGRAGTLAGYYPSIYAEADAAPPASLVGHEAEEWARVAVPLTQPTESNEDGTGDRGPITGSGCRVRDSAGREYIDLDMTAGRSQNGHGAGASTTEASHETFVEINRQLREAFDGLVACAGLSHRLRLSENLERRIVVLDSEGREDDGERERLLELLRERGVFSRGSWHGSAAHDVVAFEHVLAALASALKTFTNE